VYKVWKENAVRWKIGKERLGTDKRLRTSSCSL